MRFSHAQLKIALQCVLALSLVGCSAISTGSSNSYVYTNFSTRGELGVFSLTAGTAALVSADPSSVSVTTAPAGMAASANGQFLAVTSSTNSTITLYSVVSGTGQLTPADLKVTGATPGAVIADGSNRAFYVANTASGTISVYTLNTTAGTLTLLDTETAVTGITRMAIHPTGAYLYAVSPTQGQLLVFAVDGTGALSAVETQALTDVSGVAVHPTGGFVYVTAGTLVHPYSVQSSTGALTALTTFGVAQTATGVAIDPISGNHLYVTLSAGVSTAGSLHSLTVDSSTGLLTALSSYAVGTQPTNVWVDPTGQSVLVLNATSGSLSVFSRSSLTGALTAFAGSPIALGSGSSGALVFARRQ